jgi:hypothetical protein
MTASASRSFVVAASKMPALKNLTTVPLLAWPSIAALAFVVVGFCTSSWLALTGAIPLWVACLLNGTVLIWEFTAIHEALHRSLSSNVTVNDWLGRLGMIFLLPHSPLGVFRWYHARHHRFTNGPSDPDQWTHGSWWQLPLRWITVDISYLYTFITRDYKDPIARKLIPRAAVHVLGTISAVIALTWLGYGREVLMLWFLPTRIAFLFIGFAFFWLPHSGEMEKYDQQDDPTLASSMRLGYEPLLNIVLQFHNYHLIHHLYPSTPSYKHPKVWRLIKDDVLARGAAIDRGFSSHTTIIPAGGKLSHA